MAVKRIQAPSRFIQGSADSKLADGTTTVVPGATTLEYDSGEMYISYDGINWVPKVETVRGRLKTVSATQIAGGLIGYTANDVISGSATAGTTLAFTAVARANGAYGYITGANIQAGSNSVTPRITMLLFNAIPTAAQLNDNLPNIAVAGSDSFKYIGKVDWAALETLNSGKSISQATPNTVGNLPLPFHCASDADDLYGVLITRDTLTLGTADTLIVDLLVEQY